MPHLEGLQQPWDRHTYISIPRGDGQLHVAVRNVLVTVVEARLPHELLPDSREGSIASHNEIIGDFQGRLVRPGGRRVPWNNPTINPRPAHHPGAQKTCLLQFAAKVPGSPAALLNFQDTGRMSFTESIRLSSYSADCLMCNSARYVQVHSRHCWYNAAVA